MLKIKTILISLCVFLFAQEGDGSAMVSTNSIFEDYLPLLISNVLVIGFFLFFQRNTDQAKSQYKSHIAELEARSLRAQMNPHFIYNAINGVQSVMILKGERESNRYIGMLSKLLRFTLEMSNREGITLAEEIDYLTSYIELQRMRLNQNMDYAFDYSLTRPHEEYILPPMLLQPIVENSIIHGITPLEEKGQIDIGIVEKNNMLEVVVEDNGIGRKASQKRNAHYNKTHKSYATQILRERIDIFNYLKNQKMKFYMEDLNKPGVLAGTRSVIQIPFNLKGRREKIIRLKRPKKVEL